MSTNHREASCDVTPIDQSQGSKLSRTHRPQTTDPPQTSQLYDRALLCENDRNDNGSHAEFLNVAVVKSAKRVNFCLFARGLSHG